MLIQKKLWGLQFTKAELLHYCFKYYPRFKKGSANNSLKDTLKNKN